MPTPGVWQPSLRKSMVALLHAFTHPMTDEMNEGFEEFIKERRARADRTQRMLVTVLAVTCIMLAVSNVALALRLGVGRTRMADTNVRAAAEPSEPKPAAARTETPSAPTPEPADAPATPPPPAADARRPVATAKPAEAPPAVTLPKTVDPAASEPAEPRGTVAAATAPRSDVPPPARTDPPAAVVADATTPRAVEPPSRPLVAAPTRRIPSPRAVNPPPPPPPAAMPTPTTPSMPEEATAAWMLSTYGREAAEARARAALRFYDARSAEGRYWRGVLAQITASH